MVGSEDRLIKMTLHGVWGKMIVNGKTYDPSRGVPPMTAFRSLLKDDELAAVLTFVRNSWGNQAAPVSPASVKRIRQDTKERTTFWNPDELLTAHPLEAALVGNTPEVEEFSNIALETELLATPPAELAKIALERGNRKRGKRLFYESAGACFACHDPPRGAARLGPDLENMPSKLSHEQLVESILYPSKLIDKEYAEVKVVTIEGKMQTGVRISETDDEIVLRNLAEPDPIVIKKDDIDDLVEAEVSIMPANLTRQLKSREEFDDLMKYIIELRKRE